MLALDAKVAVALLTLICEVPPRLGRITVQEVRDRHEYVQDAWVLIGARDVAERVVQLKRVGALELAGSLETEDFKVFGCGGSDVWEVAEVAHLFSGDLCWIHGS